MDEETMKGSGPVLRMTAAEFRDGGYLQEVNRRLLHPLGMAMFENLASGEFGVLDHRDDVEGWVFLEQDLSVQAAKVDAELAARSPARQARLGWVVQPVDPQ